LGALHRDPQGVADEGCDLELAFLDEASGHNSKVFVLTAPPDVHFVTATAVVPTEARQSTSHG
jgi:hypothetical protein